MQNEHDPAASVAEMPPVIYEEGAAEFFKSNGCKCPICGSDHIEGDKTDFDGDAVYQRQRCLACGKTWSAAYRLCNLYDPDHENTFEAPLPEAVAEVVGALEWALNRMDAEGEWLDKAGYPPRFMVERAEQLSALRAALAKLKGEK